MDELKLWHWGDRALVVAESPEEAASIYADHAIHAPPSEWREQTDAISWTEDEAGETLKTPAEVIAINGRGYVQEYPT